MTFICGCAYNMVTMSNKQCKFRAKDGMVYEAVKINFQQNYVIGKWTENHHKVFWIDQVEFIDIPPEVEQSIIKKDSEDE